MVGTTLFIIVVLRVVISNVRYTTNSSENKITSFECGFQEIAPRRMPISIQFFLVALLFLIFDVEITILLPYAMEMKTNVIINMLWLFLLMLILGLVFE